MDETSIWPLVISFALMFGLFYLAYRVLRWAIRRAGYYAGLLVGKARGAQRDQPAASPRGDGAGYTPPSDADYHQEIVGESHYQAAIKAARKRYGERCPASMVFEDDNPYDKQAVAILIDGQKIGHLSRDDAREYRKLFAKEGIDPSRVACHARIFGGGDRSYGVWLDVRT